MIHIDFQGGSHGNYLEFICNTIAGVKIKDELPFTKHGTAHKKLYDSEKVFHCGHYSYFKEPFIYKKIISVQFAIEDLLQIQQISLLRAGEYNYDNDQLEINTFNKLNNKHYRWVLDTIVSNFFHNQIQESYNAVRDPLWPTINNLVDFENLPSWIQTECKTYHHLTLLELSSEYPDCPREVLREFFQLGFENPTQMGFMAKQLELSYDKSLAVYIFPFSCFYDMNKFLIEIKKLAGWANLNYNCQDKIIRIHEEFLIRQPYKNSKSKCDTILDQLKTTDNIKMPKVDLLEEAYINAKLGWNYFR